MTEYDLSVHTLYTQLTDKQLYRWNCEGYPNKFPTCGNWQMQGHQLAHGIRVQTATH